MESEVIQLTIALPDSFLSFTDEFPVLGGNKYF
jgi:hypothetical protein